MGEYDYKQYQLENENKALKKQLAVSIKALNDIIEDYNSNGPCKEDCVGYYMYHTARRALKEMQK